MHNYKYAYYMRYVIKLLLVAGSLLVASHFVDGITIDRFWPTAIIAALVLGFLNSVLRPILKTLSLPINVLTLGLFGFLINIFIFWLLTFVPGVAIDGFMAAMWGVIIVSIMGWVIDMVTQKKE